MDEQARRRHTDPRRPGFSIAADFMEVELLEASRSLQRLLTAPLTAVLDGDDIEPRSP